MSTKALLTLSASVLLSAAAFVPSAALAQLPGPLRVLRLCSPVLLRASVPVVLLRVLRVVLPSVVLRPDLPRAFRHVGSRAYLRVTSLAVRLVSMVLPDCVVSIEAAKPTFAVSKLAPRTTAATATPATVTPATATAVAMAAATVTGLMRRLRPPPPTTAATSPPIGDMAQGAFWSVMETD